MFATLSVTFPFFALVLCGYLAARRGLLPLAAIAGMNAFVLFFALPCMLYRFGASTPIAQLLDPVLALSYLCCALVMVALAVWVTRRGRIGWNDAAFGALVAAFPNTGFMGVRGQRTPLRTLPPKRPRTHLRVWQAIPCHGPFCRVPWRLPMHGNCLGP